MKPGATLLLAEPAGHVDDPEFARELAAAAQAGLTVVSHPSMRSVAPRCCANMPAKPAATPSDKAFAASMKTMMKGMNVTPTGDPDKDFVLMMMPHHQGTIDMAKVELQYGTDKELRQLATDIVTAQENEIAQMKDWLKKNGK